MEPFKWVLGSLSEKRLIRRLRKSFASATSSFSKAANRLGKAPECRIRFHATALFNIVRIESRGRTVERKMERMSMAYTKKNNGRDVFVAI